MDRHAEASPGKTAIIFVPEPESDGHVEISYSELLRQVNEFAAVLRGPLGLKTGDRVTLHMPMVPELAVTMLACARLGIIHSQVFGGFSGNACGTRIADSASRVLITMDGYYRSGQLIDHKEKADEALEEAARQGQEVGQVVIWRRRPGQYASQTPMVEGRDLFADELLTAHGGDTVDPVSMRADDPLFRMYTSGTTGRPKGCVHSTGGYLAYVAGTSKYYQDIHPDDVYWCLANIGWITGHSYIVYGPLALGTKEIESAALTVPEVAEAAAVPVIDDIRGRVVEVYVSLKPGFEPGKEMEVKVSGAIDTEIGKIARPRNVWIVPDMPKTRSGKIMRRVIASISNFADVTTLANPEIVDSIRHHVQSTKVARDDVPRGLTEAEYEEIKKFGGE